MRRGTLLLVFCAASSAGEITGVVLDPAGKPVPRIEVRLEVGRAHYALTPAFDWWYAVDTRSGTTGDDGRFAFDDIPEGAVGTVFVKTEKAVGVARGSGELEVRLIRPGAVHGKVAGSKKHLRGLRVTVWGGRCLGSASADIDHRTGRYEVGGLVPGEGGRVYVKSDNFFVAREDVAIESGETTTAKTVKVRGKFLTDDPLVECTEARLVDPDGKPVKGVQLVWSSRWMDGGMNSDEDGFVQLAGGGVAIGGPPYLLRLTSLEGHGRAYRGVFRKVRRGAAIVEVHPLHAVRGTVKRDRGFTERCLLLVVGPGDPPRVFWGKVDGGTLTVHVPAGQCRFVFGTVDGKTHELDFDVPPSDTTRDFTLP